MIKKIYNMRQNYIFSQIREDELCDEPIAQFDIWFTSISQKNKRNLLARFLAKLLGISELHSIDVNAMTLVSANIQGAPSARTVLLKEYSTKGLVFFGNYNSRKFVELAQNPQAGLLFFWQYQMRQVRFEGVCKKLSPQENEEYFATRPYDSQIGAWASNQSSTIKSRQELEDEVNIYRQKYPRGEKVPCPPFWGGYRLEHFRVEFWQGREDRLHDRFVYIKNDKGHWEISRLSP